MDLPAFIPHVALMDSLKALGLDGNLFRFEFRPRMTGDVTLSHGDSSWVLVAELPGLVKDAQGYIVPPYRTIRVVIPVLSPTDEHKIVRENFPQLSAEAVYEMTARERAECVRKADSYRSETGPKPG